MRALTVRPNKRAPDDAEELVKASGRLSWRRLHSKASRTLDSTRVPVPRGSVHKWTDSRAAPRSKHRHPTANPTGAVGPSRSTATESRMMVGLGLQFGDQPRLADSRLARDQNHTAFPDFVCAHRRNNGSISSRRSTSGVRSADRSASNPDLVAILHLHGHPIAHVNTVKIKPE
jgi:hypothetical protein